MEGEIGGVKEGRIEGLIEEGMYIWRDREKERVGKRDRLQVGIEEGIEGV
jgi:hypothetical protein